jgi:hypothetical protein
MRQQKKHSWNFSFFSEIQTFPIGLVSARVILTPCDEVKVTHLGEYGGFLEAADVDPGASSGDTSNGPTGRRDQGDREAGGMLAEHGTAVFA